MTPNTPKDNARQSGPRSSHPASWTDDKDEQMWGKWCDSGKKVTFSSYVQGDDKIHKNVVWMALGGVNSWNLYNSALNDERISSSHGCKLIDQSVLNIKMRDSCLCKTLMKMTNRANFIKQFAANAKDMHLYNYYISKWT